MKVATVRGGKAPGKVLLQSPNVNNIPFYETEGNAARRSGAYHAGLYQGDGSVIGGLTEATQLYHDVGSVVVSWIDNRVMLAARRVDTTG
jgi:cell wall-associated NlpC family hydrolase